jgi:hypothetical protein
MRACREGGREGGKEGGKEGDAWVFGGHGVGRRVGVEPTRKWHRS